MSERDDGLPRMEMGLAEKQDLDALDRPRMPKVDLSKVVVDIMSSAKIELWRVDWEEGTVWTTSEAAAKLMCLEDHIRDPIIRPEKCTLIEALSNAFNTCNELAARVADLEGWRHG